jgi:hypothetical protein
LSECILGSNTIPSFLAKSAKYATLEFAGVNFFSFSETGKDYLRHIGKDIIGKIKHQLPLLRNIVICEEKQDVARYVVLRILPLVHLRQICIHVYLNTHYQKMP